MKLRTITYCGEIDPENYFEFEFEINEARKRQQDVVVYFSTNGGSMCLAQNIVHIINTFPYKIKLIASGFIYSAGLYIFANVFREKELFSSTTGMAHFPFQELNSKNLKDVESYDYFAQSNDSDTIEEYLENIKSILTENEIKKVMNGKEVWLKTDKLIPLVKNNLEKKGM